MLQSCKDLQQQAVAELFAKAHGQKTELTFRAPTGSGKTRMMADFMNHVLGEQTDVVFLVSTLSKSELARQNYETFKSCADSGTFPQLNPYLINTDTSDEEALFIPIDYNVYVLPRDLYKKGGKLMQGAMLNFLKAMTEQFFERGKKKRIWLIKDECHQATNNLDDLKELKVFERTFNFSATPNLKRGQVADVEITDEDAVRAGLIKRVELNDDDTVPVEAAIDQLLKIRNDYNNLLGTNPCLIIQISNKDKAQAEWEQKIKPAIDKHQGLKWMYIVDKGKDCDTNDDVKRRLPPKRWKDYAKEQNSTIDIIVFKMVISEGWDIPRACMLYQMRDSRSKQLDEQVVGRVRRNPRLLDFETLSEEAQRLAMTAWVWGVKPKEKAKRRRVELRDSEITSQIKVTTTRLAHLSEKKDFDVAQLIESKPKDVVDESIFALWNKLTQCPNEVQDLCFDYAGDDAQRWWRFAERCAEVCRAYDDYLCNYDESIEVDEKVSFPVASSYMETDQSKIIETWVWHRKDGGTNKFTFDSEAEKLWADVLEKCEADMSKAVALNADEAPCLWGKNFPAASQIKYQYYLHGIHNSFPDFVMKDKWGRIHIFEVKSVNKSTNNPVDEQEYKKKVAVLKDFYKHCSAKLAGHIFYLPILKENGWQIFRYKDGEVDKLTESDFKQSLQRP